MEEDACFVWGHDTLRSSCLRAGAGSWFETFGIGAVVGDLDEVVSIQEGPVS